MRYRVEFYTERDDGTKEWCVCDYARERETGRSPIVDVAGKRTFTDRAEAERTAATLNQFEAHDAT